MLTFRSPWLQMARLWGFGHHNGRNCLWLPPALQGNTSLADPHWTLRETCCAACVQMIMLVPSWWSISVLTGTKLVFHCGSQTTRSHVISNVYALVEACSIPGMRLQEVPCGWRRVVTCYIQCTLCKGGIKQISWLCPDLGPGFQHLDKCSHKTRLLQLWTFAVEKISFLSQMWG